MPQGLICHSFQQLVVLLEILAFSIRFACVISDNCACPPSVYCTAYILSRSDGTVNLQAAARIHCPKILHT